MSNGTVTNTWVPLPGCSSAPGTVGPGGSNMFMEQVVVTAPSTLAVLTNTPDMSVMALFVNGTAFFPIGSGAAFSVTGNQVTWTSPTYGLASSDYVVAVYSFTGD
jgi:hypothetical protein